MSSEIIFTAVIYSVLIVAMTLWNRRKTHIEQKNLSTKWAKSPKNHNRDFFLANRTIRSYFAFISVIASETSVATIIVFPQIGYSGNLNLIWLPLGYIVGRFIVAYWILPDIYRYHQTSIYSTVSRTKIANAFLSYFYLISKFLSSGVRIFLASVALSTLLGLSVTSWTLFMGFITAIYCLSGGMRAVVWIDQLQGLIIYFAALLLIIILSGNGIPMQQVSVVWFDSQFSWDNLFFSPLLFLGGIVLTIGTHGTDQDILQRLLATKTINSAKRAMIGSGFGVLVLIMAYTIIGFLLANKTGLDLNAEKPLLDYIYHQEFAVWKILFGILVLAASTSTLAPAIHSMGAVWLAIGHGSKYSGVYYSFLALIATLLFAELSIELKKNAPRFLDLAIGVMNYVLAGKITIFTYFTIFKKKLSLSSISIALISGFTVTLVSNYFLPIQPAWTIITLTSTATAMLLTRWNIYREEGY